MTGSTARAASTQRQFPGKGLSGEAGDTLIIDGAGPAGLPRTGIVIAAGGRGGEPPFLVSWTTGDYESWISPGPGARIEQHRRS